MKTVFLLLGVVLLATLASSRPAPNRQGRRGRGQSRESEANDNSNHQDGSRKEAGRKIWTPHGREHGEWLRNRGMTENRHQRYAQLLRNVQENAAKRHNRKIDEGETLDDKIDDMVLSVEQLQHVLSKERSKRSIMDFSYYTTSKWTFPIKYKFDGTHSAGNEERIRSAIQHWMDNTCVTFEEITDGSTPTDPFVLFTNGDACWSYIGRSTYEIPQPISLSSSGCLTELGTAIHEIGHTLGLWHEHTRPDRDSYVTVYTDNVRTDTLVNFELLDAEQSNTHSLPYDYSSVMHYPRRAFLKDGLADDAKTIETIDSKYEKNLGQRFSLSFMDAQLVNKEYCSGVCSATSLTCQNGGYPDPKDCNRCRCPDGLSGTVCNEVAPGSGTAFTPSSSGKIEVTSAIVSDENCVSVSSYTDGDYSNWLLQAPAGCQVKARFVDTFGILTYSDTSDNNCYHWAEVKYKGLTQNGPRFCGTTVPGSLISEGNQMLVMFRSPWDSKNYHSSYRAGFKLCYSVASDQCLSTTSSTTSTTTTTTTTPQPTTTSTTTTPQPTTTSTTTTPQPTTTSTTTTVQPTTTTTTTTVQPTTTPTTTPKPSTSTKESTTTTITTTTSTAQPTTTTTTTQSTTSTTGQPSTTTTTNAPRSTTTITTSVPKTTTTTPQPTRTTQPPSTTRFVTRPSRKPATTRFATRPSRKPATGSRRPTRPSRPPTTAPITRRPGRGNGQGRSPGGGRASGRGNPPGRG